MTAGILPKGIPFTNDLGEAGVLSGRTQLPLITQVTTSWVQRLHPFRPIWIEDENRQRASFLATRRHLIPFLVPHRFEGKSIPERSRLAYGVGLNQAYLHEVFGHIRGTPAHYTWGPVGGSTDRDIITPPQGLEAQRLWFDATGGGDSWTNFFEGEVLEWMCTSPGGFVLIDTNRPSNLESLSQAEAERMGIRAAFRFIPWSWVEDLGRNRRGYRFIKLLEIEDVRKPQMERFDDTGLRRRHVVYELRGDVTVVTRYDDDGNVISPVSIMRIVDTHGRGVLPLVEARLGRHPDVNYLGTGLLMGLEDIVIDLFNLLTEMREGYRDAAFGVLKYKGPGPEEVHQQLKEGSRFVNLGDDPNAELSREAADPGEVSAGVELFNIGLKNWSLSAKRRAMEVIETANARSGVSLKAEFQLDLVPLLIAVTERLDLVETNAMYVMAQVLGFSPEQANAVLVKRETEFQLEQEASRIARIVGEFLQAIPAMPKSLLKKMIERWASSINFLDKDEKVSGGRTLQEAIAAEAEEIAAAEQTARVRQNEMVDVGFGNQGGGGTE